MMTTVRFAAGVLVLCALSRPATAEDLPVRALRLDDLYSEERLANAADWSLARDGALAIGIDRPINARQRWNAKEADIWVQRSDADTLVNITQGQSDHSDWCLPIWSPDGSRLLMQSTRGGPRRLWVWERSSGKLRPITSQSLHQISQEGWSHFYDWLDDRHVLAMVLPPGVQSAEEKGGMPRPMERINAGWATYWAGREPSVSVLRMGQSASEGARESSVAPQRMRQLVRIDVDSGESIRVMDTYRPPINDIWFPAISADSRHVVIPQYGVPVSNDFNEITGSLKLSIRATDSHALKLDRELPQDVLWQTQVWSPDGSELAFFAHGQAHGQPPRLVRVDLRNGTVTEHDLGEVTVAQIRDDQWDFARLEWTETGELVCFAGKGKKGLEKYARRDWWLIPKKGALQLLTERMQTVPVLERLSRAGPLMGLAGGKLWRLDAAHRTMREVSDPSWPAISKIVWPLSVNEHWNVSSGSRKFLVVREDWTPEDKLIVKLAEDAEKRAPYRALDWRTGRFKPLAMPAPDATFVRPDPKGTLAYWGGHPTTTGGEFRFNQASATAPQSTEVVTAAREMVRLNPWQDRIRMPGETTLHYNSLNGEPFTARVQLPWDYQRGRRYPLIAHIYPGQIPGRLAENYDWLAASMGFAVLVPQMAPQGGRMYGMVTRDLFFEIPNGVLPAVEQAIASGIADPDRLFVEGHSEGGFATYALIEQTVRFRAAIAASGFSSWLNGSFSARGRYDEDVAKLNIGWGNENMQQRPAVETQWSDLGLFLRNSPITYAERIQTPLMIVHGEQDTNVPLSNSEEMFSAMVQLGKRADFVRYWGEGHVYQMPRNVRDLWERRFAWFDQYGDIARDAAGHMIFDGDRVKSRAGKPALSPRDYAQFEFFKPGGLEP